MANTVADMERVTTNAARDISEIGKNAVADGQKKLDGEIQHIKAGVDKLLSQIVEQGETSVKAVTETVTNRPILSICGAFAVGWIASKLFSDHSAS
jgi:ElaB/YqjD/DUF883 family membrane-anchored ribosome-binding protein